MNTEEPESETEETSTPRNRYVLRIESGHPGYRNTVVLATAADLLKLSDDIRSLANKGGGRLEHYVTEEHASRSLGSLVFEVTSVHELGALQTATTRSTWHRVLGCFFSLLVGASAIYGFLTALSRLVGTSN
jgi:hypothetical protein